jgi:transposase
MDTMMKRHMHTPEQAVRKIREGERLLNEGVELVEVLRQLEVSEATFNRWRSQYGGMKADEAKRLKHLEGENQRLKKLVAEQALDIDMLKELGGKLLTPGRRRRAVGRLQERFGVSERRACRVAGQHRSTQRKPARPPRAADERLAVRLREIAREHPRWGWKTAHQILLREGWSINRKRTRRIWRQEGLRRPVRTRKRRRLATPPGQAQRLRATHANQVWAVDFQFDETSDRRRIKLCNIVDEHTREALAIRVERRCTAEDLDQHARGAMR